MLLTAFFLRLAKAKITQLTLFSSKCFIFVPIFLLIIPIRLLLNKLYMEISFNFRPDEELFFFAFSLPKHPKEQNPKVIVVNRF